MARDKKTAIIIGAGPAGLTAAYELLEKTDIKPIIFEVSGDIGGISKTINCRGNRLDIGGHRFFSKSERVMAWWFKILPLQGQPSKDDLILGRKVFLSKKLGAPDPDKTDLVMLARSRLSRIFFLNKFFNYPISLDSVKNLGASRIIKIGISYIRARLLPIRREKSLEDFYINRFGRELYKTFFKAYTEKLWGVSCRQIKADWGAQRVKGVSVAKAVAHAIRKIFSKDESAAGRKAETSLIDRFFYPKFGPGQMWETVAKAVKDQGAEIFLEHEAIGIRAQGQRIVEVKIKDLKTGEIKSLAPDYVFSSMPVKDLIGAFEEMPPEIKSIASGLKYRDFITVGLLLNKLKIDNQTKIKTLNNIIPDSWIYIQEPDIKMCRLQVFNNWSPYLISDPDKVWLGLEYVCGEHDALWRKSQSAMADFAIAELEKMAIINQSDVIDATVIKIKKAYPSYVGAYEKINEIRTELDKFENLFCIGRNGQHRYNNMDHSMLTAIAAVDNITRNVINKDNIWDINTEEEYHEST